MFHVPEDPSVPECKNLDWFPPPFGASERVKKLDDWNAGKLPGITPKLLSPEWIVCHAERFLVDYESIILEHLKSKMRNLKAVGSEVDLFAKGFSLESKAKEHEPLVELYNSSLLFYLTEVLDSVLLSRIQHWFKAVEAENHKWGLAKTEILRHLRTTTCRSTLLQLTCLKRRDGEPLLDWTNSISLLRSRMKSNQVELTDPVYLEFLEHQTSPAELRLFPTKPKTFQEWEDFVQSKDPRTMPRYRSNPSQVRVPSFNSPSKKEYRRSREHRPRETKDHPHRSSETKTTPKVRFSLDKPAKPTSSLPSGKPHLEKESRNPSLFCRYCKEHGHELPDCPKLAKKQSHRRNDNVSGSPSEPETPDRSHLSRDAKTRGEQKRRTGRQFMIQSRPADHGDTPDPEDSLPRDLVRAKNISGRPIRTRSGNFRPIKTTRGKFPTNNPKNLERVHQIGSRSILLAWVDYRDSKGKPTNGLVALDTCSSENIFLEASSHPSDIQVETVVSVCGGQAKLGPSANFIMLRHATHEVGAVLFGSVGTNDEATGHIPRDCVALLGRHAIRDLQVDLNYHNLSTEIEQLSVISPESYVSEKFVRQVMDQKQREAPVDPSLLHIQVSDDVPLDIARKLRVAFTKYKHVFRMEPKLPRPMLGEPYAFKIKPNATYPTCPPPRYTPAKAEYLTQVVRSGLESGLLEPAYDSPIVSRIHIALKPGDPPGLRDCGDYVDVNDRIEKIAPDFSKIPDEVEKFASAKCFFETDAAAFYNLITLCESTRNWTTVHTPLGKVRWTRMPFGIKNAGTIAHSRLREYLRKLPDDTFHRLANYFDDITGGAISHEVLLTDFIALLEICDRFHITLGIKKTRFGFKSAKFGGFELGDGKRSLAQRNLGPLRDLEPPRDVPSLRHILGVFVQSKEMLRNYSQRVKPLTRLTGKVVWRWTALEQKAFEDIRNEIVQRPAIYFPDFSRQLYLDTDASDVGLGGCLYFYDDDDTSNPRKVIKYISKCFNEAMLKRPIFYREAYAMVYCLQQCRFYVECSSRAVIVQTDHMPLKWIRHCRKGPVSAWILEDLAGLDYEIRYIKGSANPLADSLSRYPLIKPGTLTADGILQAFQTLLDTLSDEAKMIKKLWVWAGPDTMTISRTVQHWRKPRNPIHQKAPKPSFIEGSVWTYAIVAPDPATAPAICARLLKTGKPFSCLVPSELVSWIPVGNSQEVDLDVKEALDRSKKIALLSASQAWITTGLNGASDHVFPVEKPRDPVSLSSVKEWIPLQKSEEKTLELECGDDMVIRKNGLMMYAPMNEKARIIVPSSLRSPLVQKAHESSQHRGWKKTLAALRADYYWKDMSSFVSKQVKLCKVCNLLKCRLNTAHGQFASVEADGPRMEWGIDFMSVAESKDGHRYLLTCTDLLTHELRLIPTKTRSADEAVTALLRQLVYVCGVPTRIRSDDAKEFLSHLMQGLNTALGISHTTTMGYNARGNAMAETSHRYVNEVLKLLPPDQRPFWPSKTTEWEFSFNTTVHSSIGITPYEFVHGKPARTVISVLGSDPADSQPISRERASGLFGRIKKAATIYKEVALKAQREMKTDYLDRLNSSGLKRQYSHGDFVAVFVPRQERDWRPKHSVSWRGPMKVLNRLGPTSYKLLEISSNKVFRRNVSNLSPWTAPVLVDPPPDDLKDSPATELESDNFITGKTVAYLDESEQKLWLADVLATDGNTAQCHFRGTTSSNFKTARFDLVWIEEKSGLCILGAPKGHERAKAWSGTVYREDVMLFDVCLTSAHRISAASRRSLSKLPHAILRR